MAATPPLPSSGDGADLGRRDPSGAVDPRGPSAFNLRRFSAAAFIATMGVSFRRHLLGSLSDGNFVGQQQLHAQNQGINEGSNRWLPPQGGVDNRRRLFSLSGFKDPRSIAPHNPFGGGDARTGLGAAAGRGIPDLRPYNLHNVIITPRAFLRELFLLYYDPAEDAFLAYVEERKDRYSSAVWSPIWNRLNVVVPVLSFALRAHFPDRFRGAAHGSPEFIALFSTGDTPKLSCSCVGAGDRLTGPRICRNDAFAPILQFGSVFKDRAILPRVVTMPVWTHLPCFAEWQREGTVCEELRMRRDVAGVPGGDVAAAAPGGSPAWDALVRTLVWRGSDYHFLKCIYPGVRPMEWALDVSPRIATLGDDARGVVQSLLERWDRLTPRWKGATLTAMAGLDAQEAGWAEETGARNAQWIDSKFVVKSKVHGQVVEPRRDNYQPFEEYGIQVTDDGMTLSQLSMYRYHIDFGGGGGTTWSGTIEKLAMPGVLFHHVTSAEDYYHDDLAPWVHYIPVNEDLSNLREMFDWAEENSEAARKIAEAGTEYIKSLADPLVLKAKYERYFVHSLKGVLDAYVPMEGEEAKGRMKEWLLSGFSLVGRCSGRDEECHLKNWRVNAKK